MSVKTTRSLLELSHDDNSFFYCLEEAPIDFLNGKAIIFLHGLGENRTGLNYLFQELSYGLTNQGYTTYRFDLAGCGESSLNHSIEVWKKQFQAVRDVANKFSCSHVISRGLSRLLLPNNDANIHIAIGEISEDIVNTHLPLIPIEEDPYWWIPVQETNFTYDRELFWWSLGVEARCMGGLYLPKTFIGEIKRSFPLSHSNIRSITSIRSLGAQANSRPNSLIDCHPLFFHTNDRIKLLNEIINILK